jgi:adenine-specific DNA-methyltransferase
VILDFFAGSGTTGQAVFEANKNDNGSRNFILVQLPEPTDRKDYPTIAEITKERVRRVIQKMNKKEAGQLALNSKQDRGFRVFKLAESNFKGWDAQSPRDAQALAKQLELHIDHIRPGRTSEDVLYELLLKSGFPLTTPVEKIELERKTVYSVADGGMLICLESKLTLEAIRAMAERKPQRVVCLDMGFAGDDPLKANAVQIFKTKEIVFKTV